MWVDISIYICIYVCVCTQIFMYTGTHTSIHICLTHNPEKKTVHYFLSLIDFTKWCLTLRPPGLYSPRLLCPWNSPGKNTRVGCHFLLQGIFLTQESNPGLLHCRLIPYCLSHHRILALWIQFSSVAQSCPTLCDPMNRTTPGLPVHHQLPELTQTHAHRVGDAIQPSHPLLCPSPPAPNPSQHQGIFQWVNSSHEVVKVLEFQLHHESFQWAPRRRLYSLFKDLFIYLFLAALGLRYCTLAFL